MGRLRRPLRPHEPVHRILAQFAAQRSGSLPVIDAAGTLLGVIAAGDVEHAITQDGHDTLLAAELARETPRLHAGDSLHQAIVALGATYDDGLPVMAADSNRVIGRLTHQQLLRAHHEHFTA